MKWGEKTKKMFFHSYFWPLLLRCQSHCLLFGASWFTAKPGLDTVFLLKLFHIFFEKTPYLRTTWVKTFCLFCLCFLIPSWDTFVCCLQPQDFQPSLACFRQNLSSEISSHFFEKTPYLRTTRAETFCYILFMFFDCFQRTRKVQFLTITREQSQVNLNVWEWNHGQEVCWEVP